MQTDILLGCLKQFSHLRLRKPHGVLFQSYFYPYLLVRLVQHDFSLIFLNHSLLYY